MMESMFRWLLAFIVVLVLGCVIAFTVAGRGAPPLLTIGKPDRFVGQAGSLEVSAEAPEARLTALTIALEQNGRQIPLFSLDGPQTASVTRLDRTRFTVASPLGKQSVPELQSGPARIVVTATRPSFLKLRQLTSTASKDFQVRLPAPPPPRPAHEHNRQPRRAGIVVLQEAPAAGRPR